MADPLSRIPIGKVETMGEPGCTSALCPICGPSYDQVVVPGPGATSSSLIWRLVERYTTDAEFQKLLLTIHVPWARKPSTGTAQQRPFLVLKIVLYTVVVISEVLRLSTKSRCSRCCMAHIYSRTEKLGVPRLSLVPWQPGDRRRV